MMNECGMLRQTLADYNLLEAARPDLTLVAVRITSSKRPYPPGSCAPKGAAGWVRHRSALGRIGSAELAAPDIGPAIAGEWRVGENQTIHLRPDPDTPGQIHEVTYSVRPLTDGQDPADGEIACLRQEIAILEHPVPQSDPETACPVLLYHVFWGGEPDDPLAPRRRFTIFAGFAHCEVVIKADQDTNRASTNQQAAP